MPAFYCNGPPGWHEELYMFIIISMIFNMETMYMTIMLSAGWLAMVVLAAGCGRPGHPERSSEVSEVDDVSLLQRLRVGGRKALSPGAIARTPLTDTDSAEPLSGETGKRSEGVGVSEVGGKPPVGVEPFVDIEPLDSAVVEDIRQLVRKRWGLRSVVASRLNTGREGLVAGDFCIEDQAVLTVTDVSSNGNSVERMAEDPRDSTVQDTQDEAEAFVHVQHVVELLPEDIAIDSTFIVQRFKELSLCVSSFN